MTASFSNESSMLLTLVILLYRITSCVDACFYVDVLPVCDSSDPTYYLRTGFYVASTSIMIDRINIGREENFFSPFLPHKF